MARKPRSRINLIAGSPRPILFRCVERPWAAGAEGFQLDAATGDIQNVSLISVATSYRAFLEGRAGASAILRQDIERIRLTNDVVYERALATLKLQFLAMAKDELVEAMLNATKLSWALDRYHAQTRIRLHSRRRELPSMRKSAGEEAAKRFRQCYGRLEDRVLTFIADNTREPTKQELWQIVGTHLTFERNAHPANVTDRQLNLKGILVSQENAVRVIRSWREGKRTAPSGR